MENQLTETYLKIRNDVDLKDLEKYGFEFDNNGNMLRSIEENDGFNVRSLYLKVYTDTREIALYGRNMRYALFPDGSMIFSNLGILYDMFKDGVIEKMEAKEWN